MNCPNCTSEINKENINITTDVGQCQNCGHLFKISENISNEIDDGFDINQAPQGTWILKGPNQIIIGASTRSAIAFFLVPFMLVWSGASLGGIYGSQIISGEFNLLLSLFGIPFILGSILFWGITMMAIFGKVEITLGQYGGKIFTGIGKIGITKKFTWEEISTVKENKTNLRDLQNKGGEILLEGKKRITLGKGLNDSRRYYLFRSLKIVIEKAKSNKNFILS